MDRLARLRLRTQRTLRIALAWVVVGILRALAEHNALAEHGASVPFGQFLETHFLRSLVAGILGGGVYIFVLRDRLRHYPYLPALGMMAMLILPVIAFVEAWLPTRMNPTGAAFAERLLSFHWLGEYLYWTSLMAVTMVVVRLSDQYGSGAIGLLSGRYHKPRQELRIFMFLDMRSSTAIAEDLGHVRYFQLLNELFTEITDPIVYSRGEIYQYVGDEISVSWPLQRGLKRQRCIRCFLDIRAKLQSRAAHYKERYGIVPAFKAGFHYGDVTTGEVGLVKKERVFSGDVVNTAARIQDSCNEFGVDNLMSKELLDLIMSIGPLDVHEIGSIALRGKRSTTSLWTVLHESQTANGPVKAKLVAQNT
jgi:adenylate cyclase